MSNPQANNEKQKLKNDLSGRPMLQTEALMDIFDFNELDLNTNRNQMSTGAQKQKLEADLKDDADGMWLMVTVLLGVTLLLAFIMISEGLALLPLVIGAGIILGPLLLYAYRRQTSTRQDSLTLKVRSTQGIPAVRYRAFSDGGRYRLQVGDVSFPLTMQQAHAFGEYEPAPLRVYYTEHSKTILSAETVYPTDSDKLKNDKTGSDFSDEEMLLSAGRQYDEQQS